MHVKIRNHRIQHNDHASRLDPAMVGLISRAQESSQDNTGRGREDLSTYPEKEQGIHTHEIMLDATHTLIY